MTNAIWPKSTGCWKQMIRRVWELLKTDDHPDEDDNTLPFIREYMYVQSTTLWWHVQSTTLLCTITRYRLFMYIYTIYNIYIYIYYINIIIYIYTVYTSLVISFGSKTCLLIPNDPHPHRCCLVPKPSAIHLRLTLDFVEFVSWYPVMLSCWPCENWTCLLQPPKLADSGHWGFIVWSYPKRHDLGSESQKLQGYCEMYN